MTDASGTGMAASFTIVVYCDAESQSARPARPGRRPHIRGPRTIFTFDYAPGRLGESFAWFTRQPGYDSVEDGRPELDPGRRFKVEERQPCTCPGGVHNPAATDHAITYTYDAEWGKTRPQMTSLVVEELPTGTRPGFRGLRDGPQGAEGDRESGRWLITGACPDCSANVRSRQEDVWAVLDRFRDAGQERVSLYLLARGIDMLKG